MLRNLTVYEVIWTSAMLRLPPYMKKHDIAAYVDQIIGTLVLF